MTMPLGAHAGGLSHALSWFALAAATITGGVGSPARTNHIGHHGDAPRSKGAGVLLTTLATPCFMTTHSMEL